MLILLPFINVKRAKQRFSPETKAAGLQSPAVHQCTTMQQNTMYDWKTSCIEQHHLKVETSKLEQNKTKKKPLLLTVFKALTPGKNLKMCLGLYKDCAWHKEYK